eukprot:15325844-Ditylum_brightwellii.AAC.1
MGDLVAVDMRLKPGLHAYATTKKHALCINKWKDLFYIAKFNKRAKVLFDANQKDSKLEAKIEYVPNTKIGSNRKALLREKNN